MLSSSARSSCEQKKRRLCRRPEESVLISLSAFTVCQAVVTPEVGCQTRARAHWVSFAQLAARYAVFGPRSKIGATSRESATCFPSLGGEAPAQDLDRGSDLLRPLLPSPEACTALAQRPFCGPSRSRRAGLSLVTGRVCDSAVEGGPRSSFDQPHRSTAFSSFFFNSSTPFPSHPTFFHRPRQRQMRAATLLTGASLFLASFAEAHWHSTPVQHVGITKVKRSAPVTCRVKQYNYSEPLRLPFRFLAFRTSLITLSPSPSPPAPSSPSTPSAPIHLLRECLPRLHRLGRRHLRSQRTAHLLLPLP